MSKAINTLLIIISPFEIKAIPLLSLSSSKQFFYKREKASKQCRYVYNMYLSKLHIFLYIPQSQCIQYFMNHFQELICHVIKWNHQLSIIRSYALQFPRIASGQTSRSTEQVYIYSIIALYIRTHQFGFHFQIITSNNPNIIPPLSSFKLK